MELLNKPRNRHLLKQYIIAGIIAGSLVAVLEYFVRINTHDPQEFIPLIIRVNIVSLLITISVALFEILAKKWFRKKTFLQLVLTRSFSYTILISFWLSIINGIWAIIHDSMTFWGGIKDYVSDEGYLINLLTIMLVLTLIISLRQMDSLHRKGELLDFILGKYHEPKEVKRIFCFIDLKGSTAIGEKLGHYQYGFFLRDYYSDISDAISKTEAEIYQYVGDEIVLT